MANQHEESRPTPTIKRNFYTDSPKMSKKMNMFRTAEFRLIQTPSILVSHTNDGVTPTPTPIPIPIPKPVKKLKEVFGSWPNLVDEIMNYGVDEPSRMQSQAWPVIMNGQDMIGIADREAGHVLTFLLPGLIHIDEQSTPRSERQGPTMVYLCHTSKLASQMKETVATLNYRDIKCAYVGDDGGMKVEIIASTLENFSRILGKVNLESVSYVVLDEADGMLDSSSKIIIREIFSKLPNERQTIILSTGNHEGVLQLAKPFTVNPVQVVLGSLDFTVIRNITQKFQVVSAIEEEEIQSDKEKKLIEYISVGMEADDKAIVFCNSNITVNAIAELLKENKVNYVRLVDGNRDKAITDWTSGNFQILVVNAAAYDQKKLNIVDVTRIIIYDFPKKIEDYVDRISRTCKTDGSIEAMSFLCLSDWAVVPELIAVLRKTEQVVPHQLYDLANQFPVLKISEVGRFDLIVDSRCYVDKTLLIEKIIADGKVHNYLFTAPRKFGKTANLDMLYQFFDVNAKNKSLFEGMKISERSSIMQEHQHQYPVIWIDMVEHGDVAVTSKAACLNALRQIIHKAYAKHAYLCEKLPEKIGDKENPDRVFCEKWHRENELEKITDDEVTGAVVRLVRILHKFHNKKVLLLCDEFDALGANAMNNNVSANDLDEIIREYFSVFSPVLKTATDYREILFNAVLTGVTAITCSGPSPLNNLSVFKFLEDPRFVEYFGVSKSELKGISDENPIFEKLRYETEAAFTYYNGYCFKEHYHIMCTYSIAEYMSRVSFDEEFRLKGYWRQSGSVEQYSHAWCHPSLRNLLENIVRGCSFKVKKFKVISAEHLATLRSILRVNVTDVGAMDVLFAYFQQLGYFTIDTSCGDRKNDDKNRIVWLKIPNEEVREVFSDWLDVSILSEYTNTGCMSLCAQCFCQLNETKNDTAAILNNLRSQLSNLCRLRAKCLNEATVHHLLYAALSFSNFSIRSEVKVPDNTITDRRKLKRLDLCFYKMDFGGVAGVIEVKFGSGDNNNAKTALQQIKERKYFEIFDKTKFDRILCIGVHVNEQGDAEIVHTDDIENFKCDDDELSNGATV